MIKASLREDPASAEALLADANGELDQALEELRELARGIHPVVLTDRGLEAAIRALAGRAPVPVRNWLSEAGLSTPKVRWLKAVKSVPRLVL